MTNLINTKVLLSGAMILAAAAVVIGATFAFFSDTETSTGNTFAAGELDLKIDAEAHYAGMVCSLAGAWAEDLVGTSNNTRPDLLTTACEGTWALKDLDETSQGDKFFALSDIKPGDTGENTVSIHVFDNDAWGWFSVTPTANDDTDCTEAELDDEPGCVPGADLGELQDALDFEVWLDQGTNPGFQCPDDAAPCAGDLNEGDNIFNTGDVQLASPGPIDSGGEEYELGPILALVRSGLGSACTTDDPDGDGETAGDIGACQGLPTDGHLVGSTTYYFGVGWELPADTNNEIQTDNFVADMEFQAVQHRNNPSPVFPIAP